MLNNHLDLKVFYTLIMHMNWERLCMAWSKCLILGMICLVLFFVGNFFIKGFVNSKLFIKKNGILLMYIYVEGILS